IQETGFGVDRIPELPLATWAHGRVPAAVDIGVAEIAVGVVFQREHDGRLSNLSPLHCETPVFLVWPNRHVPRALVLRCVLQIESVPDPLLRILPLEVPSLLVNDAPLLLVNFNDTHEGDVRGIAKVTERWDGPGDVRLSGPSSETYKQG